MKRRWVGPEGLSRRCSSMPPSLICPQSNKLRRNSFSDGNTHKTVEKDKEDSQHGFCGMIGSEEEKKVVGIGFGESKDEECSSGRERLQRYRMQVAGKVGIPEAWDQEERLKEWVDPKVMDQCLAPDGLFSARTALIRDCNVQRNRNTEANALDLKAPVLSCSQ